MNGPVCAVTGASGYLGSRVRSHFAARGWTVVGLGRRDADVPFTLKDGVEPAALRRHGVTALVHCAYDLRPTHREEIHRVNVAGSRRVLDAARAAGVGRVVLVSTLSAFPGCRSLYGRAKLLIEDQFLRAGAWVVRPGLIYDQDAGGLVGTMDRLLARLPVVPLIGRGDQPMYTTHAEDLCQLLHVLCTTSTPAPPVPVVAAAEEVLSFREVLRRLARRQGRRVRLLPIPWRLVWLGLKAGELVGLRLGLRSDSVLSLTSPPPPDFTPARELGVSFRPFGS